MQQKQDFQLTGYITPENQKMISLQQQEETKIQQYMEILQPKQRSKRGALNIMGSVVKAITGNLDNEDGRRYDNQIQELQNNQKTIQTVLKHQVELMDNISTYFEHSLETMFANQEQIAHQASKNQNQINSLQAYYHRTLLLEELRQQVEELFDATTFAKAGILHPLVITPDILLSSIKNLHLSNNYQFPFEVIVEKIYQIESLIKIKAYQNNQYFVFILSIPIVGIEPYQYYNLNALPIFLGNDTFKQITPQINFVGLKRQTFITLNNPCIQLKKKTYLCDHEFEHYISENSPCEIHMLNADNNYQNCLFQTFKVNDFEVRNLETNIKILLSSQENKLIQTCNQQEDVKIIKGTYLISDLENCKFIIKNQIIKNYKSIIQTEIKLIDLSEKHKNISSINLVQIPVSNLTKDIRKHEMMLNSISYNQGQHTVSNYIIYSMLAVLFLIICVYSINRKFVSSAQSKSKQVQVQQDIALQELPQL